MGCDHYELYAKIRADMGSFPSAWMCEGCNTTIAITWIPKLEYRSAEKPEDQLQKIGRLSLEAIMAYYSPEELQKLTGGKICFECATIGKTKCSEHCGEKPEKCVNCGARWANPSACPCHKPKEEKRCAIGLLADEEDKECPFCAEDRKRFGTPCPEHSQIAQPFTSRKVEEPETYTKGDSELKGDLAHLYIHTVLGKHEEADRKFRRELLDALYEVMLEARGEQNYVARNAIEDLRRRFLS